VSLSEIELLRDAVGLDVVDIGVGGQDFFSKHSNEFATGDDRGRIVDGNPG
jgi:hypothetical protein